jgi:hypothetical protein
VTLESRWAMGTAFLPVTAATALRVLKAPPGAAPQQNSAQFPVEKIFPGGLFGVFKLLLVQCVQTYKLFPSLPRFKPLPSLFGYRVSVDRHFIFIITMSGIHVHLLPCGLRCDPSQPLPPESARSDLARARATQTQVWTRTRTRGFSRPRFQAVWVHKLESIASDGADRLQDAGPSVRGFESQDQDPSHRAAAALLRLGRAGDKARQSAGPSRSVRHPSRGLSVCGIYFVNHSGRVYRVIDIRRAGRQRAPDGYGARDEDGWSGAAPPAVTSPGVPERTAARHHLSMGPADVI